MRRCLIVMLLGLSVVMTGVGCQHSSRDSHLLDGSAWRLAGWTLSSLDPKDFTITANFAHGKISGHSGVNAYGGPYTAGPAAAFSVGKLAVTAMGRLGPDMRAEQVFLRLLGDARSFQRNGDRLVLFDKHGNESLIFRTAAP